MSGSFWAYLGTLLIIGAIVAAIWFSNRPNREQRGGDAEDHNGD